MAHSWRSAPSSNKGITGKLAPRAAGLLSPHRPGARIMQKDQTLKQLFQQEFSKMVAVIGKRIGLQHLGSAEDIVSETFLAAAETWA
jgi:hypothetical protein